MTEHIVVHVIQEDQDHLRQTLESLYRRDQAKEKEEVVTETEKEDLEKKD